MTLTTRLGRLRRPALFAILAGASLLVAHDAVFLAQVGPGDGLVRALRGGGHAYWEAASTVLLGVALLAAFFVAMRLGSLRGQARSLASARGPRTPRMRLALGLWMRLFAVVSIGFAIQENLEHIGQHGHLIGLSALIGPEYPLALPVLALITLLAGVIGAALLGMERDLLAVISAARTVGRAPRRALRPPLDLIIRPPAPLASRGAGRAPPPRFVLALIN